MSISNRIDKYSEPFSDNPIFQRDCKEPDIGPCNMDKSHKQCWVRKGKTQNYALYYPTYIKFKNRTEKQRHNHHKRQVTFKGEKFVFGKGFI